MVSAAAALRGVSVAGAMVSYVYIKALTGLLTVADGAWLSSTVRMLVR
jgi:hypothetical protein